MIEEIGSLKKSDFDKERYELPELDKFSRKQSADSDYIRNGIAMFNQQQAMKSGAKPPGRGLSSTMHKTPGRKLGGLIRAGSILESVTGSKKSGSEEKNGSADARRGSQKKNKTVKMSRTQTNLGNASGLKGLGIMK